jgi:catechol 2,3-dioxygenase-like lactoylglutathione lyase family enzyme
MLNYRVKRLFHPSFHVPDLDAAQEFYLRVFGRPSVPLSSMQRDSPPTPGRRMDYTIFTNISDVLFDTIDPKRVVIDDVQRYKTVDEPQLKSLGWYVEGIEAAYPAIKAHGIRVINMFNEVAEGDDVPTAGPGSDLPMYFTSPEDAGLRYQIFPAIAFPLDPRNEPGWTVPAVTDDDPLSIERCSHHTIVTSQPDRALRLVVDVLGGELIHEGRNDLLKATSTYVWLGEAVLEYAVPDIDSPAAALLLAQSPFDVYHAITWKVADLARVQQHLEGQGVSIQARGAGLIVTDPATSLGVPWGFTTSLTPGDPRLILTD